MRGLKKARIPSLNEVRLLLIAGFNRLLQEERLYTHERFPAPETREEYPFIEKEHGADIEKLNRRLLELAFPLEIEKSHAPYRDRLLGLIRVLRKGASTIEGVKDIVAANLGIVGDSPETRKAKSLIQFEEFVPERTSFFSGEVGFYHEFTVKNINPTAQFPEIRAAISEFPKPAEKISDITLTDINSGSRVCFPGKAEPGDRLVIKKDEVFLNGITPLENLPGSAPAVEPGACRWRFEAKIEDRLGESRPAGRFDCPEGAFNDAAFAFPSSVAKIEVVSEKYTPGVFTVIIPWHIPGFTDKFAESRDHPRHKILGIVKRVKAAGINARISYYQLFEEVHDAGAKLASIVIKGDKLNHAHEIEEDFDGYLSGCNSEIHELHDGENRGVFDQSGFDAGAAFGYGLWFDGEFKDKKEHDVSLKFVGDGRINFTERHSKIRDNGLSGHLDEARCDQKDVCEYPGLRVSNSPGIEKHDMKEQLVFAGSFDYTEFDSLNKFA